MSDLMEAEQGAKARQAVVPSREAMEIDMDWSGCEYVERVPGKVGGRPVIQGTRIESDLSLVEAELCREPEQILAIQEYSDGRRQLAS